MRIKSTNILKVIFSLMTLCLVLYSGLDLSFANPNTKPISFEKNNILVLHSYSESYEWTNDIQQALKDRLDKSNFIIDLYVEYLDTKRFPNRAYWQHLFDAFATKYQNTHINLIITSDNNALEFLFQYRDRFYPEVPVIFCGLNNYKPEMLEKQKNVTGIAESTNLKETLDLALHLHPKTQKLIFIASSARSSILNLKQLEEIRPLLKPALTIEIWKDKTIEDIEKRAHQLKSDSLIFIIGRSRNLKGEYLNTVQMGQRVSTASTVPIYSLWNFYLGTGIVGGKLIYGRDQGRVAADLAQKVLEGVSVDNIPVITETPTSYMFDYIQLKRFNISMDVLPKNSIIINTPYSFYEANKKIVWATLVAFMTLTILVIALSLNMIRRKRAEIELQRHREHLEDVVKDRTAELAESNIKLKEAQKIGKMGHWELNMQSNTLDLSDEIFRIFGLVPQKFKVPYETFLETIHPDDRDFVNKTFTESVKNKTPYDIEHRIVLKNGEEKWVREICATEYDEDSTPIRAIGTIQDITAKKVAMDEREKLINELQSSIAEVKTLRGILPICSYCKKVRNDSGYWEQVDVYIHKHSEADISHSICQDCMKEHYLEEYKAIYSKKD